MAAPKKKVNPDETILNVQDRSIIKVINAPTDYVFRIPFISRKPRKVLCSSYTEQKHLKVLRKNNKG